jgi:hypothetical protein
MPQKDKDGKPHLFIHLPSINRKEELIYAPAQRNFEKITLSEKT